MSKSTVQILKDARELLSDPTHWTKFAFARDSAGFKTKIYDSDAVCWCVMGAIMKESGDYNNTNKALSLLEEVISDNVAIGVGNDNEDTTHSDVMETFSIAIEKAEEQCT